jgi:hypothetical protein
MWQEMSSNGDGLALQLTSDMRTQTQPQCLTALLYPARLANSVIESGLTIRSMHAV